MQPENKTKKKKVDDTLKLVGVGGLLIAAFVGGDINGTPNENVYINDDKTTPKEQLPVHFETPTTVGEDIVVADEQRHIDRIIPMLAAHRGYLETFENQLAQARSDEDVSAIIHQRDVALSRIKSYEDTIAYYQRRIDKAKVELDKLPERVEVPDKTKNTEPIIETTPDEPSQ